jgi:hypothetical protein
MFGRGPKVIALSSSVNTFEERGQGRGAAELSPGDWLAGAREPSNTYDRNALLVHDEARPGLGYLGYLNADVAALLSPKIDSGWGAVFLCTTAYLRQSGAWTLEVISFCFRRDDLDGLRTSLNAIAQRVRDERLERRYSVEAAAKNAGDYGLGFTLISRDIPASNK